MARESFESYMKLSWGSAMRYLAALLGSGKNPDDSDFSVDVNVISFPENEEVIALASGMDTEGGRTSADIVNKYGRGVAFLVDVAEVNGSGSLETIQIEAKIGDGYATVTGGVFSGPITDVGQFVFWFVPNKSSNEAGFVRNYHIRTITTTDAEGNDITYSITVVHLL